MSDKITILDNWKRKAECRPGSRPHHNQCQTAMGDGPRVRHLECAEHQTTITHDEKTADPMTGDIADVARPSRLAASFFS